MNYSNEIQAGCFEHNSIWINFVDLQAYALDTAWVTAHTAWGNIWRINNVIKE